MVKNKDNRVFMDFMSRKYRSDTCLDVISSEEDTVVNTKHLSSP